MNRQIAICIPTYNHSYFFKEFIDNGIPELYKRYGIDVYVYDSSEDNETERIMSGLCSDGYNNFYYIRLPKEIFLDTKLMLMLSGYKREKEYDYVWPCRDSTWFLEKTLICVRNILSCDYDIVVLNPENKLSEYYPPAVDKEYTDINEFYHEVGAYLTGMMGRIFRYKTILEEIDWVQLCEKYRVWVPNGTFLEIAVIFERLAVIEDKFRGILISNGIAFYESNLKNSNSHWRGKEFEVWGKCWPYTISLLPDKYINKEQILKEKAHFNDVKLLKWLRQKGVLNLKVFFEIVPQWEVLSYISKSRLFFLSISPRCIYLLKSAREEFFKKGIVHHYHAAIKKILRQDPNPKIALYGAGEVGKQICDMLRSDRIEPLYFVETKCTLKNAKVKGLRIVEIRDFCADKTEDVWIIVSVVPRIQKQIKKEVVPYGLEKIIYL